MSLLYLRRPRAAGWFLLATVILAVPDFLRLHGPLPAWTWSAAMTCLWIAGVVICFRTARSAEAAANRPWYSRWTGLLAIGAAFACAAVLERSFVYEPYRAPSSSMLPSVNVGANLVVQKWGYGYYGTYGARFLQRPISAPLQRGDIIVFDYPVDPSQTYVKRLIGMPGDVVEYRKDVLSLNGKSARVRQDQDYLDETHLVYLERVVEKLDGAEYPVLVNSKGPTYPLPNQFDGIDQCSFEQAQDLVRCKVPAGRYFVLGDHRSNSLDSRAWGFVRADQIIGKVVLVTR